MSGIKLKSTPGVEVITCSLEGCDECSDDYEIDGSQLLVFFTECVMLGVCRGWRQSGFFVAGPFLAERHCDQRGKSSEFNPHLAEAGMQSRWLFNRFDEREDVCCTDHVGDHKNDKDNEQHAEEIAARW